MGTLGIFLLVNVLINYWGYCRTVDRRHPHLSGVVIRVPHVMTQSRIGRTLALAQQLSHTGSLGLQVIIYNASFILIFIMHTPQINVIVARYQCLFLLSFKFNLIITVVYFGKIIILYRMIIILLQQHLLCTFLVGDFRVIHLTLNMYILEKTQIPSSVN